MPIKHAIWKAAGQPAALSLTKLASERQPETYCREYLVNAPPACGNEFGPSAA